MSGKQTGLKVDTVADEDVEEKVVKFEDCEEYEEYGDIIERAKERVEKHCVDAKDIALLIELIPVEWIALINQLANKPSVQQCISVEEALKKVISSYQGRTDNYSIWS